MQVNPDFLTPRSQVLCWENPFLFTRSQAHKTVATLVDFQEREEAVIWKVLCSKRHVFLITYTASSCLLVFIILSFYPSSNTGITVLTLQLYISHHTAFLSKTGMQKRNVSNKTPSKGFDSQSKLLIWISASFEADGTSGRSRQFHWNLVGNLFQRLGQTLRMGLYHFFPKMILSFRHCFPHVSLVHCSSDLLYVCFHSKKFRRAWTYLTSFIPPVDINFLALWYTYVLHVFLWCLGFPAFPFGQQDLLSNLS